MNTKKKTKAKFAIRKITGHISFGDMIHSYRVAQELTQVEMSSLLDISKFVLVSSFSVLANMDNFSLEYKSMSPININIETNCGMACGTHLKYRGEEIYQTLFTHYYINNKDNNNIIRQAKLKGMVIDVYLELEENYVFPDEYHVRLKSRKPTDSEVDEELKNLDEQKISLEIQIESLKLKLLWALRLVDSEISHKPLEKSNVSISDEFKVVNKEDVQIINKLTQKRSEIELLLNQKSHLENEVWRIERKLRK